jgi:hypothetical protein
MATPHVLRQLSVHRGYACAHSGRCCRSGWTIPVEPRSVAAITAAGLAASRPSGEVFIRHDDGVWLSSIAGACVLHDDRANGGCQVHRALGPGVLPAACRQFPRVAVHDPAGVSVTLSHYCPTAAGLLRHASGDVSITVSPVPEEPPLDGFRADPGVPPLLHQACLLDWDSWWAIETLAVTMLTADPARGLGRLAGLVETLREWSPRSGPPLADAIQLASARVAGADAPVWTGAPARCRALIEAAMAAIPDIWRPQADAALAHTSGPPDWTTFGRFLAAHAFANWTAYGGRGLRAWFRSIEAAAALLWTTGDPGSADLILRHLADSSALIARWNQAEAEPLIPRP